MLFVPYYYWRHACRAARRRYVGHTPRWRVPVQQLPQKLTSSEVAGSLLPPSVSPIAGILQILHRSLMR